MSESNTTPQYTDSAQYNASQAFVLKLIWSFLLFANAVFALTGYLIMDRRSLHLKPEMLQVIMIAMIALAIISALLVFGLAPFLRKKLNYMVYCVLRWSLTGSAAINGFVLFMLGDSFTVFLSFLAWDTLIMLLLFPESPVTTPDIPEPTQT